MEIANYYLEAVFNELRFFLIVYIESRCSEFSKCASKLNHL